MLASSFRARTGPETENQLGCSRARALTNAGSLSGASVGGDEATQSQLGGFLGRSAIPFATLPAAAEPNSAHAVANAESTVHDCSARPFRRSRSHVARDEIRQARTSDRHKSWRRSNRREPREPPVLPVRQTCCASSYTSRHKAKDGASSPSRQDTPPPQILLTR